MGTASLVMVFLVGFALGMYITTQIEKKL